MKVTREIEGDTHRPTPAVPVRLQRLDEATGHSDMAGRPGQRRSGGGAAIKLVQSAQRSTAGATNVTITGTTSRAT